MLRQSTPNKKTFNRYDIHVCAVASAEKVTLLDQFHNATPSWLMRQHLPFPTLRVRTSRHRTHNLQTHDPIWLEYNFTTIHSTILYMKRMNTETVRESCNHNVPFGTTQNQGSPRDVETAQWSRARLKWPVQPRCVAALNHRCREARKKTHGRLRSH